MFKNYLKTAVRNISRYKGISAINIGGLAVGMACAILILLFVQNELSFNKFNKNDGRIYRMILERSTNDKISYDGTTPPALAPALKNDFPQNVKEAVRFLNIDNPLPLVSYNDKHFYEKQFFFADADVFDVFTFHLTKGNPKTALQKPNSIVLTESSAQKYFGNENPVGKTLSFNNFLDLEVTGVVENPPANSTIQFDFLTSFSTLNGWLGNEFVENWNNNMCQTYVLLSKNSLPENIVSNFPAFIGKYISKTSNLKNFAMQPLDRIHLYSNQDYQLSGGGDIQYVYLLSAIALFVLIIACFNFISLTTARSVKRSKEVGVKKVLGATKAQLVKQFFTESLFMVAVALSAAVILVEIAIPYFNTISGKNLSGIDFRNWSLILLPAVIVLLIGLISNIYPAFVLSSFKPVQTIKGNTKNISGKGSVRKILVAVQFSLTIILIICTWVVYNQLDFIKNKKLGFDKDQVLVVPIRDQNLRQNPEPLKEQLKKYPGVLRVGAAALLPGGPVGKTRYIAEGNSESGTMSMLWVDPDFISTLNIKLAAGRGFSKDNVTDASEAFVINEEAVKQLGWNSSSDAIGKTFELAGSKKGKIIGVVKDFNFTSLHEKIGPVVLHLWPWLNYVLIKVNPSQLAGALENIKEVWNQFEPGNPFSYTFLDDNFSKYYQSETQFGQVSGFFTFLAIMIACLGLFSLSMFTVEQRIKEFGIRKVLGASGFSILGLQIREFVGIVLIANIFALPLGFYFMNVWLRDFAYRIDISWWVLVLSGGIALLITLLTVSFQAIKAAIANPVNSIKYE